MKKIIFITALLISGIAISQKSFNQFSIEADYGLSLPISNAPEGTSSSDFLGFNHFMIGARYMIIPEIGAKLSYSYGKFQNKNFKENHISYNRIDLQAVSNLVYLFGFDAQFFDKVGFLAHAGVGVSYVNPSNALNNERVGNAIFGISPIFRLGDKFAITTDFSYLLTFKQHFSFDGQLINPDYKSESRGFMYFKVGVNYYIGKNRDHADWL